MIRYETSKLPAGETITLSDYVGKMGEDQKDIYYLAAPSRELAEQSPYYEAMKVIDFLEIYLTFISIFLNRKEMLKFYFVTKLTMK